MADDLMPQGALDVAEQCSFAGRVLATGLAAWWTRHNAGGDCSRFCGGAGWRWLELSAHEKLPLAHAIGSQHEEEINGGVCHTQTP